MKIHRALGNVDSLVLIGPTAYLHLIQDQILQSVPQVIPTTSGSPIKMGLVTNGHIVFRMNETIRSSPHTPGVDEVMKVLKKNKYNKYIYIYIYENF